MSLKAFHVLFIAASILLFSGLAVWAGVSYRAGLGSGYLLAALGSGLAAASLVVYGRWFLRKLKAVSYL